jgi:DNA modification methylase
MVMVAHADGGKLLWADDKVAARNIFSLMPPRDRKHPNEKPLGLCSHFISLHTIPDQLVLDPFMGSGSTGVACANLGRKFIGVELEPKYFDIACKRIDQAQRQGKLFTPPKPKPEQGRLL